MEHSELFVGLLQDQVLLLQERCKKLQQQNDRLINENKKLRDVIIMATGNIKILESEGKL